MAKKQAPGAATPAATPASATAAPSGAVRKRGRPRRSGRGARPEQLPVRAVRRAFDLLGLLGQHREAPTLSEMARGAALPVSTVARLLATLEQTGFVRRATGGGYAPGGRLLQMGLAAVRSLSIYDVSEQYLRRLSDTTGETANLATRADAGHAIYLRHHVSSRAVQHVSWLGRTLPLDKTAIGHALLGRVNSQGFVARRNTLERDVTAIAAPVYGPGGEIVAAFSITGPTFRISDADIERFGGLVVREARLASSALGAPHAGQ
jgi:DNA-binding IclR family transcriptional regulator